MHQDFAPESTRGVLDKPIRESGYGREPLYEHQADLSDPHIPIQRILRRRWKAALIAALLVIAGGITFVATRRPVYEAHAQLVLVTSRGGASNMADSLLGNVAALTSSRNADTQIEILKSPDLLNAVWNTYTPAEQEAAFGPKKDHDPKDDIMLRPWNYQVENKGETDVVTITGRSFQAKYAADVANKIGKLYLDRDLDRNNKSAAQAREYVDKEIDRTQTELNDASKKLADYQKQHGLAASDPATQAIEQNVMALRQEVIAANSNLNQVEGQIATARRQLSSVDPTVIANASTTVNPEFTAIQAQLTDLESQLSLLSRQYKPGTLPVRTLEGQVADAKARLKGVTQNMVTEVDRARNPVFEKLLSDYATVAEQESAAKARVNSANSDLATATAELNALPEVERQFSLLQEGVNVLQSTYEDLKARHYELQIQEQSGLPNGVIASFAHPPLVPAYPRVMISALVTLILASLAAWTSALFMERRDRAVHDSTPFETMTGLPVLAVLPEVPAKMITSAIGPRRLIIAPGQANPGFLEAFRILRNSIAFSMPGRTMKVIAVTSPGAGEGKSTTSINLAIALGMDGKKVLIIDVDLRRPSVHNWMASDREKGLTAVVSGQLPVAEAIHPSPYMNVEFIPSGPIPPNPSEFLNAPAFRDLIEDLRLSYDIIVLDTPPTTGLSDVQVVSTLTDGILLVVGLEISLTERVIGATRMLRLVDAPLMGIVLNRVKQQSAGYAYYYYDYAYTEDNPRLDGRAGWLKRTFGGKRRKN